VAGGGPSHGASTRTSTPIERSTVDRPITCACTPPGTDRLYGHTMPTRSGRRHDCAVEPGDAEPWGLLDDSTLTAGTLPSAV